MALLNSLMDRLKDVFVANSTNDTAVRTVTEVSSSSLPTGASTSAKQDTIITELQTINSLVPAKYDYVGATYPTTSSEVYTFKIGGSGGTTVSTITVVYTDTTKEILSSVTKS